MVVGVGSGDSGDLRHHHFITRKIQSTTSKINQKNKSIELSTEKKTL